MEDIHMYNQKNELKIGGHLANSYIRIHSIFDHFIANI